LIKSKINKSFIYLISPNKIKNNYFYIEIEKMFKTKKISFFQLRLKNQNLKDKTRIGKKIFEICKKHKVKFIVNDDPFLAKKVMADGCHLGQKDMDYREARKILGKKIIGATCHNSKKLIKKAIKNKVSYIALGAFFSTKTKLVKYRANIKTL
jgi:thiamine-phosphate pyrophosphorylase